MGKVVERHGHKYSLKPFEGYKYRAKFVAETENGSQLVNTDVYTTNIDKANVLCRLSISAAKNYPEEVHNCNIVHWASKEQDDATDKMLEEFLHKSDD